MPKLKRPGQESTIRGAVRLSETKTPTGGRFRKMSMVTAIGALAGGLFITTTSTGKVDTSGFKTVLMTAASKSVPVPTFRFDDADAILSDHSVTTQLASMGRPQNNAFEPQAFASLLPPLSGPALDLPSTEVFDNLTSQTLSDTTDLTPLTMRLPSQILLPQTEQPKLKENYFNIVEVKPGNTFLGILEEQGLSSEQRKAMLQDKAVTENLSHLKVGEKLTFEYRWDGQLDNISVKINRDTRIKVQNNAQGEFNVARIHLPIEHERVVTAGNIDQSLYLAAEKAQLKQSTIMSLADIFEWELDFARDIRKGDSFSIVYDRLYRDGKYIGDGEILAAEFTRGDRVHRAVRFTDDNGHSDYYSPDGQSKRRAFMRHPVDVVRITSRFDPNRLHPVLHKIRAHKGVDYGAPHGSPIYATADGKISFSGDKNAYGNTVVLKHGDNRSTLYAHMSRISKKSKLGARVKRGEVIGYVGKSGRVTGTHLHYEFRIADKHVDPLKVELPGAPPLDKKYHGRLKTVSNELLAQMRSVIPNKETVATGPTQ